MKSKITTALMLSAVLLSMPGMALSAQAAVPVQPAQAVSSARPAAVALSSSEKSELALLGSAHPGLMDQRAGDRVYVEDGGGPRWHRGYGYGIGGLLLTVLLVTAVVIVLEH